MSHEEVFQPDDTELALPDSTARSAGNTEIEPHQHFGEKDRRITQHAVVLSAPPSLIANAGKPRIMASVVDDLFAVVLALAAVGIIRSWNIAVIAFVLCFTYLAYYFVFEALWAKTPGKFFQGLIVSDLSGARCTPKQALIRTLTRTFEVNPLILGGIPAGVSIITSNRNQRIGDRLAGTLVISSKTPTGIRSQ